MKTSLRMDPTVAFPEADQPPSTAEMHEALGEAAVPIDALLARLTSLYPGLGMTWQFSTRAGWFRIHALRKRRLFYLVPKQNDFRLSLILGPRALADLDEGPFNKETARLLPSAKRYPEGIAFSFNRRTLQPDLVVAFLAAKLAH